MPLSAGPFGLALLGLALLLAAGACGGERPARSPAVRATWVGDRLVEAPAAQRLVSTLPGITESVAWLGGVDRLVGISPHCDRPPEVLGLRRIPMLPPDLETLAALRADLVLADAALLAGAIPTLRASVPVLVLRSATLEDLADAVDLLAVVVGTEEATRRAVAFRRDLEEARAGAAPPDGRGPGRVLLVAQASPLHVLGPGALLDDLVRACGGENVAFDLGRASGPFAEELVLARRPDWILTMEPLPPVLRRRWATTPALGHGRVARADADDLVRAGPRIPGALGRLADVLHGRRPPSALAEAP